MKIALFLLGLIALFFGADALLSRTPMPQALALLLVGSIFVSSAAIIDAVDKLRAKPDSKPAGVGPSGETSGD